MKTACMLLVIGFTAFWGMPLCHGGERPPEFYRREMIELIKELHRYAEGKHAGFGVIPNGGVSLYLPEDEGMTYDLEGLLGSIDGVLAESVFYGADLVDNKETPKETTNYFLRALEVPKKRGLPVFSIDYCSDGKTREASREKNRRAGFLWFAAPHRALDIIPEEARPGETKDFLVLLNPSAYGTREKFLRRLRESDYDFFIIDPYFGGEPWREEDLELLREKPGGGRRLIYAYMSVGEAENYRGYWKEAWNRALPDWMAGGNEDWPGSYRVRYWRQEWKDILYGSPDSCLDRILGAGFDGVFLDVVDVFHYFEENE